MQLEIKDSDVKGVVVVVKEENGESSPWYLRVISPEITKAAEMVGDEDKYLWYMAAESGWELVVGKENYQALEAAYMEQLA